MTEQAICPECVQGKHGNCNGEAWDMLVDGPTQCACAEVQHDEALLGGRDELDPLKEFTTALGCKVRISPAPQHLGAGVLLVLNVDVRFAEVYLNPEDIQSLKDVLP